MSVFDLQKQSYDIYVKNLTVSCKLRLVQQINEDIESEYAQWCELMKIFLHDNKYSFLAYVGQFSVQNRFSRYGMREKRCVITYNELSQYALYIIDNKIGVTTWDDTGSPISYKFDISDIDNIVAQIPIHNLKDLLQFFIETHPLLK